MKPQQRIKLPARHAGSKKESCGSSCGKTASVTQLNAHRAAMRGAALAKEAMMDPELREFAMLMSKEAGFWGNVMGGAAALGVGAAITGVAGMGVDAARHAYRSLTEGKEKAHAYSEMMRVHGSQLGTEEKAKVQQAFNALWHLNPELAKEPLTAGTFVARTIDYGGVATQDAATLLSARKSLMDAKSHEDSFGYGLTIGSGVSAVGAGHNLVGK